VALDCRVKPGNDDGEARRNAHSTCAPAKSRRKAQPPKGAAAVFSVENTAAKSGAEGGGQNIYIFTKASYSATLILVY